MWWIFAFFRCVTHTDKVRSRLSMRINIYVIKLLLLKSMQYLPATVDGYDRKMVGGV